MKGGPILEAFTVQEACLGIWTMNSKGVSSLLVFVCLCLHLPHSQLSCLPGQRSVRWQWPTTAAQGASVFRALS